MSDTESNKSKTEPKTESKAEAKADTKAEGFSGLGLAEEIVAAVTALGYEEPTPIQREAIPILIQGRDLLGQAATGTGKTAAFALPMIQRIAMDPEARRMVCGLILVPTRELSMQVAEAVHKYAKGFGLHVLAVYGGAPMFPQIKSLQRGSEIVVATPGRALDLIRRGAMVLDGLKVLALDEADEMLDMGFAEDLDAILEAMPKVRQTALFSATMPARIKQISNRHLNNPARVAIEAQKPAAGSLPKVRQVVYSVTRSNKPMVLSRVLDVESPAAAIVFCRTRIEVENLCETLSAHGHRAEPLHGGMQQRERDRVMKSFRGGNTELLVATDIAARGLDIDHLSHVVNYDVPAAAEDYVHRIGRTGRAGREGVAITLAEPREHRLLRSIEQMTKQRLEIGTVPTVADLRARRLDLTRASLREAILAKEFDDVRVVVETLSQEFDVFEIAAAAVKLVHIANTGKGDDAELATGNSGSFQGGNSGGNYGGNSGGNYGGGSGGRSSKGGHGGSFSQRDDSRSGPSPRKDRGAGSHESFEVPSGGSEVAPPRTGGGKSRATRGPTMRIFIGAGRQSGVRPADLVGSIANEAKISSGELGAIEIADRFSLVEVPEAAADRIIAALRATTIRGKKVTVRLDRDGK